MDYEEEEVKDVEETDDGSMIDDDTDEFGKMEDEDRDYDPDDHFK